MRLSSAPIDNSGLNIVVTFDVTYEDKNNPYVFEGTYKVTLNAAGGAEFKADDENLLAKLKDGDGYGFAQDYDTANYIKTFTIKSVSGKVIFTP